MKKTVRVFFRPDGGVSVMWLNPKRKDVSSFDAEATKIPALEGVPFEDMENTTLPPRAQRGKWRWRMAGGQREVHVDDQVRTKQELMDGAAAELEAETKKRSPDTAEVSRLCARLEILRIKPPDYWERT